MPTRRTFLPGVAVLCVAAAALAVALAMVAPGPAHATATSPIRHIIVLMQENHSLDSELGFWCDTHPSRCSGMPASVKLADGTTVVPGITPARVPPVNHGIHAQALGLANKWDQIVGCTASTGYACISDYPPSAVPNLTALAAGYTILDHAFTMNNAPSWGGHLDELAATMGGFTGDNPHTATNVTPGPGWGCDSNRLAGMLPVDGKQIPDQPACVPDFSLNPVKYPYGGAFRPTKAHHVQTILDEMNTYRVSWKIYAMSTAQGHQDPGLQPAYYGWSACPSFADCLDTSQDARLVNSNMFFTDAGAGALPSVSFVMPTGDRNWVYSQHNGQNNNAGDNWIGKVADAVFNGPDGPSSALIITYDDCGCFYDQVTPPPAPDGRRMGPRVPFVIVSPYAKPGYTDTTVTSATGSILALIEANFRLPALGVNDASADNLMGDFNFTPGAARLRLPHMVWRKLPASAYRLSPQTARQAT